MTNRFLIDATFVVKASHEAFLGVSLLEVDGDDHTFTYGLTRDLLRLRQTLGAAKLTVIFGKEAYAACDNPRLVSASVVFLKELGMPIVDAPGCSTIDIGLAVAARASHLVSAELSLLQLTQRGLIALLMNNREDFIAYDVDSVRAKFGVDPALIPDWLALTDAPKDLRLTKSQAVRLLERFGGLEELLTRLDTLRHHSLYAKLKGAEQHLRQRRAQLVPGEPKPEIPNSSMTECHLNTVQNTEILRARKFHSLVRLLQTPPSVRVGLVAMEDQRGAYVGVADGPSLERLGVAVRQATTCAIDTEATGTDPHRAELLGVSFCFQEGEAFYVPVTTDDLRGIDSVQVVRALQDIGQCGTAFVGHNIKYDCVLLGRYGINLSNVGFDTMLAAHECFRDWEFFNLKHLAQALLGKTIKRYKEVVKDGQSLLDVPFRRLVDYACEDAETTLQLFKVLNNELQSHGLQAQFESQTMPLAMQLERWEREGVAVNEDCLQALRQTAWANVRSARDMIHRQLGKTFDVDSDHEVRVALEEDQDIRELVRNRRATTALLETLAGNNLAARLLVQYRREKERLKRIEDVLEQNQDGKIHPVFNQISSRYGRITAKSPDLFATNALREVVQESVRHLYPDTERSLRSLARLSRDQVLSTDLKCGYPAEFTDSGLDAGEFL